MDLIVHVDGGARGNPGPAGAGVVIKTASGESVHEAAYYLGSQTNNFAEYIALIRALERVARTSAASVVIHSDSELLVRQITGDYQVKAPHLKPLFQQAQTLLLRTPRWQIRHVRREQNKRADELANLAMDERRDVILFDTDGSAAPPAARAEAAPQRETAPRSQPDGAGEQRPASPPADARLTIQLSAATAPNASACPAALKQGVTWLIGTSLPEGLCTFAAQSILPTIVAMLSTDVGELRAIPTLTVRCAKQGCGAVFTLTPVLDENGAH